MIILFLSLLAKTPALPAALELCNALLPTHHAHDDATNDGLSYAGNAEEAGVS